MSRKLFLFPLVVTAIALFAVPIGAAEPASTGSHVSLADMNVQARKAWVGTMLERLDEANRAVLASGAVAEQHSRFERTLSAFVEDRANWQSRVAEFEGELVLSQRAAVEHLTRRYRMDAYQLFRSDREAFERYRLALKQLLADWRGSDAPAAEQYQVIRWLAAATRRSDDSQVAQLPPLPEFTGSKSSEPPRMLARSEMENAMPISAAPSRLTPNVVLPDVAPSSSPVSPSNSAPLAGPQPAGFLADRTSSPAKGGVVRPAIFRASAEIEIRLDVPKSTPHPHHVAMLPSFEPNGFMASLKPAAVAQASQPEWRKPSSVSGVTRPVVSRTQPSVVSRLTSATPGRARDPFAFARTKIDHMTMVSTLGRSASLGNSDAPSAASTASSSPSSVYPEERAEREESLASLNPNSTPGSVDMISQGSRVPVSESSAMPNLDELDSRIRGNNVALQKLAAQLYEDRGWDAQSLTSIYDQLAPLVARKDDLKLIRELVPLQQRDRVGDLETGSDLISDLGSKIARARNEAQKSKTPSELAAHKEELERLDRLSQKLAGLVFSE